MKSAHTVYWCIVKNSRIVGLSKRKDTAEKIAKTVKGRCIKFPHTLLTAFLNKHPEIKE